MVDTRTYFKVTNGYFNHPKIVRAGSDAGWLDLSGIGYCSENLTDGLLPASIVPRLSDKANALALAKALLDVGRWHETGHMCDRCVQPEHDEYVVHDFLEHQRSAGDVSDLRKKRSEAGKRGGKAKANALANAKQTPKQNAGKDVAVSVTEEKKTTSSFSGDAPTRTDVEQLCRRLSEWLTKRDVRHKVGDNWRTEARRLLDLDEAPLQEALKVLDWSQRDGFWRGNVHSIPTFREKYQQLRDKSGIANIRADAWEPEHIVEHSGSGMI